MKNLLLFSILSLSLLAACTGAESGLQAAQAAKSEAVIYMGPT